MSAFISPKVQFHVFVAIGILLAECFLIMSGYVAIAIAAVFFVKALYSAVAEKLKGQQLNWAPSKILFVYLVCVAAVLGGQALNNDLARKRGEIVVSALKQYKDRHGHFPKELSMLVPDFIGSIPSAKVSLAYNEFEYLSDESKTIFFYVERAPFSRVVFDFEQGRWNHGY